MIYRRIIEPLGVPVDFSLRDLLDVGDFAGEVVRLDEVETWIDYEGVSLRVIALEAFLTDEDRALLRDECFWDVGCGGDEHKRMIALSWLYLWRQGKTNACRSGSSGCSYAGGWADACVPGENYFVECGTMQRDKPLEAMRAGQSLLMVPYRRWKDAAGTRWRLGYELRPAHPMTDYGEILQREEQAAQRRTWDIWRPPSSKKPE